MRNLLAAEQKPGSTRTLAQGGRRRHRPPYGPPGGPAGGHRARARRPLGDLRRLGRRRHSRRDRPPAGLLALSSSTCCSRAPTRASALDISAALDAVGGELNAFTAKEYTCYYARVLDADLPLAVDVVCDMVTRALIRREDVDAERGVILEEIAMRDDDPVDVVHDEFSEQSSATPRWAARSSAPSSPSRACPGPTVARLLPAPLPARAPGRRGRRQRRPRGGRTPGPQGLRRPPGGRRPGDAPAGSASRPGGRPPRRAAYALTHRRTEQANLVLGGTGPQPRSTSAATPSACSTRRSAAGCRSRLFQEVREKRGLAYSVYSYTAQYAGAGLVRRLRRLPARQGRRRSRPVPRPSSRWSPQTGITAEELAAARASSRLVRPRARGHRLADDAGSARASWSTASCRAVDDALRPDRRRDARRGARRRRRAARRAAVPGGHRPVRRRRDVRRRRRLTARRPEMRDRWSLAAVTAASELLRVGVLGAAGRMGAEVCRAVDAADDLELVGADRRRATGVERPDAGAAGRRRLHAPRRGHGQPRELHRARASTSSSAPPASTTSGSTRVRGWLADAPGRRASSSRPTSRSAPC